MPILGELSLEDAATQAAGNWQRFNSFIWFRDREVQDAEQWAIIYTHNRDSGLLDQSNAKVIAEDDNGKREATTILLPEEY